jgi:DNA-binding MarR family transcriptional regulator
MSTAISGQRDSTADGVAAGARPDARTVEGGAGVSGSVDELVAATATFVDAFDRWSRHKAAEAGASIPRLRLLYSVHGHGPQKMADLAAALDVTPRNVTALVDGLESEGLVRRVAHATDRRITLVELTCSPDRVAAQFGAFQASMASLYAELAEEDRGDLLRILGSLQGRLRTLAGCSPADLEQLDA